jgi:hypothetical protein
VQWTHGDGAKQISPILGYGGAFGEIFIKHVLASTIKKGVPLRESRPSSSSSSGMRKTKVILIGFLSSRSHSDEG